MKPSMLNSYVSIPVICDQTKQITYKKITIDEYLAQKAVTTKLNQFTFPVLKQN